MNERIKELAEQAGGSIWVAYINPDGEVDDQEMYEKSIAFEPPEKLEKFAELIINECLSKCDEERNNYVEQAAKNNGRESDFAVGSVNSSERIAAAIKEHFGVEK